MAVSQDFPTRGEVYDFNVGDIFQFRKDHTESNGIYGNLKQIYVWEKSYSINTDTVNYVYTIITAYLGEGGSILFDEELSEFESYTDLDEIMVADTVYENPNEYNGRTTTEFFEQINNYIVQESHYTVGCGQVYHYFNSTNPNDPLESEEYLTYFKKGFEEWGDPWPVYISITNLEKDSFYLYPNPALGFINVESNENSIIQVYSTTGQLMMEQPVYEVHGVVEVSILPKGVYIIQEIDPLGQVKAKSKFLKL